MARGNCRHCGYSPVAVDAIICPRCAGNSPNPGFFTKLGNVIGGIISIGILGFIGLAVLTQIKF